MEVIHKFFTPADNPIAFCVILSTDSIKLTLFMLLIGWIKHHFKHLIIPLSRIVFGYSVLSPAQNKHRILIHKGWENWCLSLLVSVLLVWQPYVSMLGRTSLLSCKGDWICALEVYLSRTRKTILFHKTGCEYGPINWEWTD